MYCLWAVYAAWPNVLKRGGGSSNVHVVLKGGVIKMFMSVHKGEGGVKIVPNPVHVVCERPPWHIQFCNFDYYT